LLKHNAPLHFDAELPAKVRVELPRPPPGLEAPQAPDAAFSPQFSELMDVFGPKCANLGSNVGNAIAVSGGLPAQRTPLRSLHAKTKLSSTANVFVPIAQVAHIAAGWHFMDVQKISHVTSDGSTDLSSQRSSDWSVASSTSDDEQSTTHEFHADENPSEDHLAGTCKPCLFAHKPGGCVKGVNCKFCHFEHDLPLPQDKQLSQEADDAGAELPPSEAHLAGTCRPCLYAHKPGGCDKGASCEFCHQKHDSRMLHRRHLRSKKAQAAVERLKKT
jgi:hypothetical protein